MFLHLEIQEFNMRILMTCFSQKTSRNLRNIYPICSRDVINGYVEQI